MAHGSKKWICAIDTAGGRVKRSRHRSIEDKLGRLAVGTTVRRRDYWTECECCRAEDRNFTFPPWERCSSCRAEEAARHRAGWNNWAWLSHAPKWFRKGIEGQYRARVRNLLANERYDDLPQRGPRDAAWNYW